jgi:hypothetical protein
VKKKIRGRKLMQYYMLRLWEYKENPIINADIKDQKGRYLTKIRDCDDNYVYFEEVNLCYLSVSDINELNDIVSISNDFLIKKSISSILKKMNLADGLKELPILITDKNKKTLDGVCLFPSIPHYIVDSKNKLLKGNLALFVKKWPLVKNSIPENVDIIHDFEMSAWFVSEKFKNEIVALGLTGFVFGETYFV